MNQELIPDKKKMAEFKREFIELCKKHNMTIVPLANGQPCAHDEMCVVELNSFWLEYIESIWL